VKNKVDKNSKRPSGKSKEPSASDIKGKGKHSKPPAKATPAPLPAKKAKSGKDGKPDKNLAHKPVAAAPQQPKSGELKGTGKASQSPSQANRKSQAPVSKRPATLKPSARARGKSEASDLADDLSLEEFSISLIKAGETKERIWRTKSFQQHTAQREFGFPDLAPELPGHYSHPTLVLMPKDPEYMFCYWELTPTLVEEKGREKMPGGNYRETLKINWESKSLFEPNFTFIPVFFWARKWYFGVPQVGQRYQVELGWLSDGGHFISILSSNLSELPESWAITQKRLADQGEVLAYSSRHTKTLGSSDHLVVEDSRTFIPEWNLSSESMTSSSWSRGVSAETGASLNGKAKGKPTDADAADRPKPRSTAAKTRLEVAGKVRPGTLVSVSGKPVFINGQGYFKTEFPYQRDSLSLELTSASGVSRSFTYDLKELVLN
jgi:Domain of unknown function (DUF4912)